MYKKVFTHSHTRSAAP